MGLLLGGCGPRVLHFGPQDPFVLLDVFLGPREEGCAPFPAWLRPCSAGVLQESIYPMLQRSLQASCSGAPGGAVDDVPLAVRISYSCSISYSLSWAPARAEAGDCPQLLRGCPQLPVHGLGSERDRPASVLP